MNDASAPVALTIADGTPHAVTVLDVRGLHRWSLPSSVPLAREVFYHHTADYRAEADTVDEQFAVMRRMADSDKFGLPYNFLVWPDLRVYYLNEVDRAWPHTFANNGAVAIAAQGNYDVTPAPLGLAERMGAVTYALATMWEQTLRERFHRDVFATACPGRFLAAALVNADSYSG